MRRLRVVAATLLLQLQLLHAARLDSADFGSVLGQITKGNRMEQCPCVRPPEGGACISYDARYQASHVEEAMISFVDLSLPDREKPTDADSLACVSAECRACFSLLFYRILEVGLLPRSYRPAIPLVPQASLNPSMCPRLRFPTADDFSATATAAAAAVPPSAAITGLIERGARFERAAQAAQAASEALSRKKDEQAKRQDRKKQHRNQNSRQHNNNNHNNNNANQVQVPAAQQQGQGRSGSTPSPSRQFTVQQQLRVQQPSFQQQQQFQQQQWQQQQQIQQQQWQQQQFNTQQQFGNQPQFNNQFNQVNPQQLLQTARQINTIADTISMATHASTHWERWRPQPTRPQPPRPHPGGPGPGDGSGPGPGHGFGSNEESGEYHGHHHRHQPQDNLQPFMPGPQGESPTLFGNAASHAGAGPQGPFPGGFPGGFPGPVPGPFPGHGGGVGGGVGGGIGSGGGGGGDFQTLPWRGKRSVLSSQTGANHREEVEMEVVSPLVSPLIPKELRPTPVEVSFTHDGEHAFSEERSAFAELTRQKRQQPPAGDDGILGSRFTIACFERGESENGGEDKMLSLCGGCWVWRRLPEGFFPPIVNELVCKKSDKCLSGWGRCVDKTRSVNVLRKVRGQWTAAALSTGTCCDCKVVAGSEIHSLIIG